MTIKYHEDPEEFDRIEQAMEQISHGSTEGLDDHLVILAAINLLALGASSLLREVLPHRRIGFATVLVPANDPDKTYFVSNMEDKQSVVHAMSLAMAGMTEIEEGVELALTEPQGRA